MATELDREYGADTEMAPGGKAMITAIVAHKPCQCYIYAEMTPPAACGRCIALDYIKKHWPWWYFATIGTMGADDES